MKYTISEEQTLLQALKEHFPDSSNRTLKNWISFGRVDVDGVSLINGNQIVKKDQVLTIKQKEQQGPFPIIYQDRSFVIIDKPSGLLSVPDDSDEPHALGLLREFLRTPGIFAVHRIDQETSGTLLFAKGKKSEELFDSLFEKHALKREYIAIVEGRMTQESGTWESYLREKENYDVVVCSPDEGKRAITHFEVLRRSNRFSYVRFTLETGRKHQIRVQSNEAGHPITGDFRYGATGNPIKRMALHAHLLQFVHPFTGKMMTFTAPIPKPFLNLGFPDLSE